MKKKSEKPNYISTVCSCRLNSDQIRRLDAKAMEKGLERSVLVKYIILEFLDKDIEHTNLLQSAITNVANLIEKNSRKQEFFQQLFYSWLVNWFAVNPTPSDTSEAFVKSTIERRNTFAKNFMEDIYNDATELYESLFADSVENQSEEESTDD